MLQHETESEAFAFAAPGNDRPPGPYVPTAATAPRAEAGATWNWVSEPAQVWPAAPLTVEEVGVAPTFLEDLLLKQISFIGPSSAETLSQRTGLSFAVTDALLMGLKTAHMVEVTSGDRFGELTYKYRLTGRGDQRAIDALGRSRYTNVAPVPLEQYVEVVKKQSLRQTPPSPGRITNSLSHFIIEPDVRDNISRALHSGRTTLIFGASGNGKTAIIESYAASADDTIIIPYALYAHGQLIRIFDSAVHTPVEDDHQEESGSLFKASARSSHLDQRWLRVRRPVVIVGGELTHESLELSYDPVAHFYQAPPHLKAQDGVFVIDDFGRQRIRPEELLNRWIVPMERGYDMLGLNTGENISVPFEIALIFSTNLHPTELVDEAFLRRIAYKVLLPTPTAEAFKEIARRICSAKRVAYTEDAIDYLTRKIYAEGFSYQPKSVYPRDIAQIVIDISRFDGTTPSLTPESIERAMAVYFIT